MTAHGLSSPSLELSLPPSAAADLNAPAPLPHHDSEEFVRSDRHRTAQELEDLRENGTEAALATASIRESSREGTGGSPHTHGPGLDRQPSQANTGTDLQRQSLRWYDGILSFWRRNVCVTIEEGAHRDHLALERTFLGYLRTSLALTVTGVITAQIFRLQHSATPNSRIGYFVLGVPLAVAFMALGMLVLLLGAFRFWRQQNAIIRGKVYAGGWEITGIMVLSLLICVVTLILLVWVDVDKTYG